MEVMAQFKKPFGFSSAFCFFHLFLWLCPFHLSSQAVLCSGNLGDNIFTDGTFGSGTRVIFPTDPGYAPGFQYTTSVPPDDGEYTLTTNMALWSNHFDTWLQIGDNSPDPNGYMMVVNASFTPGNFYEQDIVNICENTLYQFSADIINIITRNTTSHILPNVTFLIDNVVVYTTGQIPQDEKWHTYGFTFTTTPGQTSLKLTLRNNAPGGIGNDLALDNISFQPCGPEASISIAPEGRICENSLFPVLSAHVEGDTGSIQWQTSLDSGFVYTDIVNANGRQHQINLLDAGTYFFRYLYSNSAANLLNPNCRIVSDPIRVEVVPVEFQIADTICDGLTFDLGGIQYGQTGIYTQQLTASNGCDSIVTLNLIIVPDPQISANFDFSPPSCEGASDGSISVLSVSGTRPPYFFRINDSIVPSPGTLIYLPAGIYTAWIEDPYGCYDNQVITIPDGPPLLIKTIEDTTIVLGHPITLTTTSTLPVWFLSWNPDDMLSCSACLDPIATPFYDTTYVVSAETQEGCIDFDSVRIRVRRDPVVYIPNVFTPNDDGINDFFQITSDPLNIRAIKRVIIFDRWGGVLNDRADLFNEGEMILWDGTTEKGPANPGVYVYLIEFVMADEKIYSVAGDVTVFR